MPEDFEEEREYLLTKKNELAVAEGIVADSTRTIAFWTTRIKLLRIEVGNLEKRLLRQATLRVD